ncbi:MAG: SBBP repeat-containing protein [Deltaproteobacteria bacterium]|nr:SBBP repeat-containing protein [Deltaproteobacteria bacterium]
MELQSFPVNQLGGYRDPSLPCDPANACCTFTNEETTLPRKEVSQFEQVEPSRLMAEASKAAKQPPRPTFWYKAASTAAQALVSGFGIVGCGGETAGGTALTDAGKKTERDAGRDVAVADGSAGDSGTPDAAEIDGTTADARAVDGIRDAAEIDGTTADARAVDGIRDAAAIDGTTADARAVDGVRDAAATDGTTADAGAADGIGDAMDAGCRIGETVEAYSGPEGTEGVGICQSQIRECTSGTLVTTQEEALPQPETCNGLDNDCNGNIDGPIADWTITYNGAANLDDVGVAITLDLSGNVYVTGSERILVGKWMEEQNPVWTMKYDQDGNPLWPAPVLEVERSWRGEAITADPSGNVYITGTSPPVTGIGIPVIKYDSEGNLMPWPSPVVGGEGVGRGQAITSDLEGNIYVTGRSEVDGVFTQIWASKYDSAGNPLWPAPITSGTLYYSEGRDIAVDSEGNIYVTGYEEVLDQGRNIWTMKYDPDGNPFWPAPVTYNGLDRNDEGRGIAVDFAGNVYVAGSTEIPGGAVMTVWVNKYDTDGNPLWDEPVTHVFGEPWYRPNLRGYGIALGPEENIYVTGAWGAELLWINKYDPDGNPLWPAPVTSSASVETPNPLRSGTGIAVDFSENVYVTGFLNSPDGDTDIWIRKYVCTDF